MSGLLAGVIITDAVALMFLWHIIARTRRTHRRIADVRNRCHEIRVQTKALLVGVENE